MTGTSNPTAREVYQLLKDVALGVRAMGLLGLTSGTDPGTQLIDIDVDGWQLRLSCVNTRLERCEHCRSPDARFATLEHWQRFGTNPVDFLSQWEHQQLDRLLEALYG